MNQLLSLTQCKDCGEYIGSVEDDGEELWVDCICHGIPCSRCGVASVHRPVSNYFDKVSREIVHVPHFKALCADCVLGIRAE